MSKVLQFLDNCIKFLDNCIKGFLNWVYSLPPDAFKEYEAILVAYLVAIKVIAPDHAGEWIATGFVVYGIVKAIRDVSNASVAKAQVVATANLIKPKE